MTRDYFSYTVILADTTDLDTQQNAKLKALSGVTWDVDLVLSDGSLADPKPTIYGDRTGGAITNGGTTAPNGLIEFWAEPGEYRVNITDPANRVSSKALTWSSVPGQDGSIPGDFVSNDNELDLATLADEVKRQLVPIGAVIDWWRPDSSISVPTGFAVCDGSVISSSNHGFGTGQSITLPDLRNKFVIGANTAVTDGNAGSAGTNASNAPGIRGTGGSNAARDLTHNHSVPGHNHTLTTGVGQVVFTNPTYSFAGNALPVHSHFVSTGGGSGGSFYTTDYTAGGSPAGGADWNSTSKVPFYAKSLVAAVDNSAGTPTGAVNLASTGSISGKAGPADGAGISNGDAAFTTGAASANITSSHDFRPAYVGLLKIMKVKWS
jgi:hypothetical protein